MSRIKKILISQPAPLVSSPYKSLIEKYQVEVDYKQFIQVQTLSAKEFRQQRVVPLDYTAIIFTSRTAITHFFELMTEMRIVMPDTMKYFCISESLAPYLQKFINYRKRKVFFAESDLSESFAKLLVKHKVEKFLLPVAEEHGDQLTSLMDASGLTYTKSVMFRTVSRTLDLEQPLVYDMIIFFTPKGVESLFENLPNFVQGNIRIGAVGPKTAQAVEESGLRLDLMAMGDCSDRPMHEKLDDFLSKQD